MAFNLQAGFGAGEGADMLQSILKQKAQEAYQNQQLAQEQQRIQLAQQEAQQRAAYQAEALKSLQEDRAARQAEAAQGGALKLSGILSPGQTLDPNDPAVKVLQSGNLGPLLQQDKTLSSTNLSGPAGGPMTETANPGQLTGQLRYVGTPQQLKQQQDDAELQQLASDPSLPQNVRNFLRIRGVVKEGAVPASMFDKPVADKQYEVTVPGPGGQPVRKLVSAADLAGGVQEYKTPQQPAVQLVTTVDENGNPVQKFVQKKEGQSFAKPVGATVENRVAAAKTVNEVGNDIIQKLSDPKVAATLGPVMGRYSTLQDFIGDPPPEYSELAGEIESYALANMGVHGMRSAQGAAQIQKLLTGKHTPASLAATIKGLNNFSTTFVNQAQGKGGNAPAAATAPAAPNVIRYDMNGNRIGG